jgi:hypothetical protein
MIAFFRGNFILPILSFLDAFRIRNTVDKKHKNKLHRTINNFRSAEL